MQFNHLGARRQAGMQAISMNRLLMGVSLAAVGLAASPASAQSAGGEEGAVNEIIVTAQKREQRLQDVPISITAIDEDALAKRGYQQMGDYLLAQPSVVIQDRGPARNQIVIRGVSTLVGYENPTVAFYLGETPLTTGIGIYSLGFPDFKSFDVNRVEVLRGPQGTLYGAGSMGGTVKVVPNEPEFGRVGGQVEASVSITRRGDVGGNIGAAFNLPIGENAALRVVGYQYESPGYIDNAFNGSPDPALPVAELGGASWTDFGVSAFGVPARYERNVNSARTRGARAYLSVRPTDRFKITLGGVYQKSVANGLTDNLPSLGAFKQSRMFGEGLEDDLKLASLTATYELDGAQITSATAYLDREQTQDRDVSVFFLNAPLRLIQSNHNKNFTQELRIASSGDGPFTWLLGGFYSKTTARAVGNMQWLGTPQSVFEFTSLLTALGALNGPVTIDQPLFRRNDRNKGEQIAGFGEIGYAITDTVTASAGLRVANYKLATLGFGDGAFSGGTSISDLRAEETVKTPKFQLEFKPDQNQLYYVKAAKGFRLGSPNLPVSSTCDADLANLGLSGVPPIMKSDTLWSYEAGVKQTLGGGRATVNASAFYIDWKDIQTSFLLPNCGFSFGANAGNATSKGVELEINWRPAEGLTLNGGASFTDARLSNDSPAGTGIGGKKNDRLPGIPRWAVQGGIQYDYPLLGAEAFSRIDVRYISDYLNRFPGDLSSAAQPAGDFAVVDMRLGVAIDKRFSAEIYGANIFDNKQFIVVDTELPDQRQVLGRPRTVGVTLRYQY